MNPKLYTDILRVLQGSRLVAKAVVTVVGNDTTSISSSLGKHVAEVLVHAQNVIKSRPTDSSSPSTCNDGISEYEMKTSNNFNETTPITEFHTPNLSESTPINLKTDLKGSISTEYTKLGSVQTLSSVIKSENVSFPTIDIHPAVKHDATSPSSIETMESYSSYSHIQEGRPVPSTRISRAMGFASLGVGLAAGTAMEYASRLVGQKQIGNVDTSIVFNASNSDRLAKTLCRMRGAALKLGQLLSIQDEDNLSLPTPLSKALQHVRQNAEAMPLYQLRQQLKKEWKDQYDEKEHLHVSLESMDSLPFAAASIGECLRGVLKKDFSSGKHRHVVIKVQYPGVAESIESDLSNLQMLVSMTGLAPKGLFLDNIIRVGRQELKVECDYIREAQNQKRFKGLIEKDDELQRQRIFVPAVIDSLSTQKVLATEYCPGYSIDIVSTRCDQEERNRIARAILYLTMKELFCWRFMQTDPNWGNFLYDPTTKSTYLVSLINTQSIASDKHIRAFQLMNLLKD